MQGKAGIKSRVRAHWMGCACLALSRTQKSGKDAVGRGRGASALGFSLAPRGTLQGPALPGAAG